METGVGVFNVVLMLFVTPAKAGIDHIRGDVYWLFVNLAGIYFVWAHIKNMMTNTESSITLLVRQCMSFGFMVFILTNYEDLSTIFAQGFFELGLRAGASTFESGNMYNPTKMAQYGFVVAEPVFFSTTNAYKGVFGAIKFVWHVGTGQFNFNDILIPLLCGFVTVASYCGLAIQMTIALIEMHYALVWCFFMIGLSATPWTRFAADAAKVYLFETGMKLFVIGTIFSGIEAGTKILMESVLVIPEGEVMNYGQMFTLAFASLTFFFTSVIFGEKAGRIISGPKIEAGGVAKTVLNTAHAVTNPAQAATKAVVQSAGKAVSPSANSNQERPPVDREGLKQATIGAAKSAGGPKGATLAKA